MSEEYLFSKEIRMKYVFNLFIMKTLQCSTKRRKYKSPPCYRGWKNAFLLVFQRDSLYISFEKRFPLSTFPALWKRASKAMRALSIPTEKKRKIFTLNSKKILDISFEKRWSDVKSWIGRKKARKCDEFTIYNTHDGPVQGARFSGR